MRKRLSLRNGPSESQNKCGHTSCGSDGTPSYISPETALQRKFGFASDVWAFGLILVGIATGMRAWGSLVTAVELATLLVQSAQPLCLAHVPIHLTSLCEKCLAYSPKDRPTMMRIAADLREMTIRY